MDAFLDDLRELGSPWKGRLTLVWTMRFNRRNGHYDHVATVIRDDAPAAIQEVQDACRKPVGTMKAMQRVEAAARPLYDAGASDMEIARAVKCGSTVVRKWRLREGLPSNFVGRRQVRG